MSIAEVASGTVSTDSAGNWTVTKPAAVSAGHLGLLGVSWDASGGATLSTPTGWTSIAANVGSTMKMSVFYRLIQGGDSTWAVNQTGAGSIGGIFKAFSGVDQTTPIDATGTANTNTGSATITANAVTIATLNAWHIIMAAAWNTATNFTASGFTAFANGGSANQPQSILYNTTPKSLGSTGTTLVTGSAAASGQILAAATFAIRPAIVANVDQEGYRFRNDDGSESTATFMAAQETNISLAANTIKRLRMLLNATSTPGSKNYQLEYRKVGDSTWRKV